MGSVKCFKRQAATCAALADETYDEDSRLRFKRLEQMYLHLAESEETSAAPAGFSGSTGSEHPLRAN
jgi:hypothetical protein